MKTDNINYDNCPDEGIREYKECAYPHYGLAPHRHNIQKTGNIIGSTEIDKKETWPDNFKEDPDVPGCGVYSCPYNCICKKQPS